MKKLCFLMAAVLFTVMLLPAGIAEENPLNVSEEGFVITGDGWTCVNTWCKEGDADIFGRMYYPADFDPSKQYDTVLMIHGMTLNADFWHKVYAPAIASAGYICYAIDERSGTSYGRGSFSTPTSSGESYAPDAVVDASAALDFLQTLDYVKKDSIYLFGNSKGSMAVQILGAMRSDDIAGIIALYGNVTHETYFEQISHTENTGDTLELDKVFEHPYSNGEVLIIWGAGDSLYTWEDTMEDMAMYDNASLVLISDAYHGFGNMVDRAAVITTQSVIDYLNRCTKGIEKPKKRTSSTTEEELANPEEGFTHQDEGYYFKVMYSNKGDTKIFGRMYYPENFNPSKKYPVVILSHGNLATADLWDKTVAPRIAREGECLAYAIDAQSETDSGRGSYSTPLEGVPANGNTYSDYADDIIICIDQMKTLDYIDTDGIYLMGLSKGGRSTQLAASRRSDDIRGVIIQAGAVSSENETAKPFYDEIVNSPYHSGEVLYVGGTVDQQISIELGHANMDIYSPYTFVAITKTGHGFGYQNDRSNEILVNSVNEFIHRTYNRIGEKKKK